MAVGVSRAACSTAGRGACRDRTLIGGGRPARFQYCRQDALRPGCVRSSPEGNRRAAVRFQASTPVGHRCAGRARRAPCAGAGERPGLPAASWRPSPVPAPPTSLDFLGARRVRPASLVGVPTVDGGWKCRDWASGRGAGLPLTCNSRQGACCHPAFPVTSCFRNTDFTKSFFLSFLPASLPPFL